MVAGLVERPPRFALLDRGAPDPVAPVSAGKTKLISLCLRASPAAGAVAWLGVERGE